MAEVQYIERKWKELPPKSSLEPNAKYFIEVGGGYFRFYITSAFGDLYELDLSAASVTTLKFFLGDGDIPDGYIQVPLSTTIQSNLLVGKIIQGFVLVNGTPYEPVAAGILFDPDTGTMDLSVFGEFYDGGKVVLMVSN